MSAPTEYELKVLRRMAGGGLMAGDGLVAITAAARRLERKGLAVKGRGWYVTDEGRAALAAAKAPGEPSAERAELA